MQFDPLNFLSWIKTIVMGGGRDSGGRAKRDSGFLVDRSDMLGLAILPTGVTFIADSNGFPVLNAAASNTAVTTFGFQVPRDYDEATDQFEVVLVAHMDGATDTPTITIDPDKQIVGSAPTQMTIFTGGSLTSAALSATATAYSFNLTGNLLKRNQLVKVTVTSGAHTTDALQVLAIRATYRSTLVSYNETDGATVNTGTSLR